MKTPISRAALTLGTLAAFGTAYETAFARVGEPQETIERRILQPNLGKMFFKPKEKETPHLERERQREEREIPFVDARKYFPAETKEGIYWKSAVAGQLSSENGWKVHVFYVGGRSALEAYRRVGEPLNDFEVRSLLAMNKGNSSWKKIPKDPEAEKKQERAGAFHTNGIGYDYELEDGTMRAKQKGDWLMIFSTRLDNYVIEQQKQAKEEHDKELEKLRGQQQGRAPESVNGF